MHPELEAGYLSHQKQISMRYFVLSEAFLRQHGLTQASVQNKSYNELTAIAGVRP